MLSESVQCYIYFVQNILMQAIPILLIRVWENVSKADLNYN